MCSSIAGWETWPCDAETKGSQSESEYTVKVSSLSKVCTINSFLPTRAGYSPVESSFVSEDLKEISAGG